MAKTWVLDTETKGTGAEMVPLEKVLRQSEAGPGRRLWPPRPPRRRPPAPKPRPPARFRVVDVLTRRTLVGGAGVREAVAALEPVRSVVDVTIDVWSPEEDEWRRLTHAERRVLWGLRGRARGATGAPGPAGPGVEA